MANLGDAFIDVHANTDPFAREVQSGVDRGAELAEDDLDDVGRRWGEVLGDSMGDELGNQGPKFARGVEDALQGQRVRVKGIKYEIDKSGNIGRRWVSMVTEEIEEAFRDTSSGGGGGIFSKFNAAFADAIGAGFNVSGRSPLVAFLLPLVGVIAGLILAAVQAVNSLVAAIITIPAAIAGVLVSVGVLAIAFDGVGEAIQGAFAAKNAQELNKALQDLSPSAQAFVRDLLPLKQFFKDLQPLLQESFFSNLGKVFGPGGSLQPLLEIAKTDLVPVAGALGLLGRSILESFGSPEFQQFVKLLLPELTYWLKQLGPSLSIFLTGINDLSTFALPFLRFLGEEFNENFRLLGEFFSSLKDDPGAQQWLEDMETTFRKVEVLITEVIKFVAAFFDTLNKAGGDRVLDALSEAFDRLTFFLQTDVGKKSMEGLISLAVISIQVFTGLLVIILLVLAAIEKIGELIALAGKAVGAFFSWLGGAIKDFVIGLGKAIVDLFSGIPGQTFTAGRNALKAFADGIYSMLGYLKNTVISVLRAGLYAFLPHSPAKEGPLSGEGDPLLTGRRIMDRLAGGMTAGLPAVRGVSNNMANTIAFGANAINVNFMGALPTSQQAQSTGASVGQGIVGLLNRDTSLGVRSLAPMGAGV